LYRLPHAGTAIEGHYFIVEW